MKPGQRYNDYFKWIAVLGRLNNAQVCLLQSYGVEGRYWAAYVNSRLTVKCTEESILLVCIDGLKDIVAPQSDCLATFE